MRIAPEGWPVLMIMAGACAAVTGMAWWLWPGAGGLAAVVSLLLWAWGVWFFRDPVRQPPALPGAIVSPADGKVIKIDRAPLPTELRQAAAKAGVEHLDSPMERVAIFLNLFNVHVNRTPARGRIVATTYVPGKFFNASLDKASEHNERSSALMVDASGRAIGFSQIAGLVARRIVNHLKPGQEVACGERFGLIRFGSRAEVYAPLGTTWRVKVGEGVVAGETVLAGEASPERKADGHRAALGAPA